MPNDWYMYAMDEDELQLSFKLWYNYGTGADMVAARAAANAAGWTETSLRDNEGYLYINAWAGRADLGTGVYRPEVYRMLWRIPRFFDLIYLDGIGDVGWPYQHYEGATAMGYPWAYSTTMPSTGADVLSWSQIPSEPFWPPDGTTSFDIGSLTYQTYIYIAFVAEYDWNDDIASLNDTIDTGLIKERIVGWKPL